MPWEHTFLKSVAPLRVKPLTLAVLVLLYIRLTLAVLDHTHSLFSVVWTKRGEVSFVGKKSDSCLVSLSEDSSCQVYCKDTFQSLKPAGLVSLFCGFHLRTVILISWVFSSCQMLTFVSTIPQLFFAFCHHFFVVVCARQPDFKSLCSSPRQNKLNWGGFMFSELQWAGWFKVSVEIIITSVSHHQQSFHLRGVNEMLQESFRIFSHQNYACFEDGAAAGGRTMSAGSDDGEDNWRNDSSTESDNTQTQLYLSNTFQRQKVLHRHKTENTRAVT